ncbi:MAG: hypothetical protein Kow00124_30230 [Anaerolineae bacterium]
MTDRTHSRKRRWALLALIALLALACALPSFGGEEGPSKGAQTAEDAAGPEQTPEADQPVLEQKVIEPGSGISVSIPAGWYSRAQTNLIEISNQPIEELDEATELPPGTLAMAITAMPDFGATESMTLEQFVSEVLLDETMQASGEPQTIQIGRSEAVIVDLALASIPEFEGMDLSGFLVVVDRADGGGLVVAFAAARPEDWPGLRQTALDILNTLEFSEPGGDVGGGDMPPGEVQNEDNPQGRPPGFVWQVQRPQGTQDGQFGRLGGMAPRDGILYVADADFGLWKINAEDGFTDGYLDLATYGVQAVDVAFGSDPTYAYVAEHQKNTVVVVDLSAGMIIGEMGAGDFTPGSPISVAVTWDDRVFATDVTPSGEAILYEFGRWGGLIDSYPLATTGAPLGPVYLAFALDGSLYLVSQMGVIIQMDLTGMDILLKTAMSLDETGPIADATVGMDGGLYLAAQNGLFRVDPASGAVLARYGTRDDDSPYMEGGFQTPRGIAAFLDGSIFYSDCMLGQACIVGAFRMP